MQETKHEHINKVQELISQGKLAEAHAYCTQCIGAGMYYKEIMIYYVLFRIMEQEMQNQGIYSFDISADFCTLDRHYHILKFLVRRLEFDWIQANPQELVCYCVENNVSLSALLLLIQLSTKTPKSVLEKVKQLFAEYQGSI